MVCLRNISVDTLHKGDTEEDDDNNNNNNNNIIIKYMIKVFIYSLTNVFCWNLIKQYMQDANYKNSKVNISKLWVCIATANLYNN